jgi:hypothetical protein
MRLTDTAIRNARPGEKAYKISDGHASIEAVELLESIRRTEDRGARETARRCLGYCVQIFRYAIATGRVKYNAAADFRGALAPVKSTHFASIPIRVALAVFSERSMAIKVLW